MYLVQPKFCFVGICVQAFGLFVVIVWTLAVQHKVQSMLWAFWGLG